MQLEEYGRSTGDRINYLIKSLSEDEKKKYYRLDSFIKIWAASVGGSADINQHTDFFITANNYSLRHIDAIFFKKFGIHIERHAHQLQMSEEEWKNGIPPTEHQL